MGRMGQFGSDQADALVVVLLEAGDDGSVDIFPLK
jgi:hypothetical protein